MTLDDLRSVPDPADLVASARLDGEPTALPGDLDPEEVAAHQAELSAAADLVARPVTLPAQRVIDAQVSRALDGLVAPAAGRWHRWVAVAATIALVAGAGAVLAIRRLPGHGSTTVAAKAAGTTAGTPRAFGEHPGSASAPRNPLPDLGSVASAPALRVAVLAADPLVGLAAQRSATVSRPSTATTFAGTGPLLPVPSNGPPTCDGPARSYRGALGPLEFVATATYQGTPIEVLVYAEPGTGGYRLLAAAVDKCPIVVDMAL